jgi:replication factor C subunit 3/5
MILIDKYKVCDKSQVEFNKSIFEGFFGDLIEMPVFGEDKSKNMIERYTKLPNLLITGYGKKTFVNVLLNELYGSEYSETNEITHQITGYGNKKVSVNVKKSKYHIVIEPTGSGIDKYIVDEIINEYADQKPYLLGLYSLLFKFVIITNADLLSSHAQTSLRCTMEMYHKTCKFILCTNNPTKLIEPLQSRCITVRLPKPEFEDLVRYANQINIWENMNISFDDIINIVKVANNDLRKILWYMDYKNAGIDDYNEVSWTKIIDWLIDKFLYVYERKQKIDFAMLKIFREDIGNILITNISESDILVELQRQIVTTFNLQNNDMEKVISAIQKYNMRLVYHSRPGIHIEALIIHLFEIFYAAC